MKYIVLVAALIFSGGASAQVNLAQIVKDAKTIKNIADRYPPKFVAAEILPCTSPEYPPSSFAAKEEGSIILTFGVSKEGELSKISLDKSSGFPALDGASLMMLYKCHFKPAMAKGKPVTSETTIAHIWKLAEPHFELALVSNATPSPACKFPQYPEQSLKDEEEGNVALSFDVSKEGDISNIHIDKSSGYSRLDSASIDTIADCKFKPTTINGQPVSAKRRLAYVWRLADDDRSFFMPYSKKQQIERILNQSQDINLKK